MSYDIKLENFEGPLDLLLHLIRQHEMDIYDIPIAQITHQYLMIIDRMKQLNLDVAGEFLLMAATLIHIKSRMLLPVPDEDDPEEEEDPRAELVTRLLEYQRYKDAAGCLESLPQLEREVFIRHYEQPEAEADEDAGFETVGLYELAQAFQQLLEELPEEKYHTVMTEPLSVTDRINAILGQLAGQKTLGFNDLFSASPTRQEVVVSFLAMLEMVKMRLVKLVQTARLGPIWIQPAVEINEDELEQLREETLGYG